MVEYLIKDTSLKAIGDEVRTLEGVTNAMSVNAMQSCLHNANTEVNNQTDLIAQISTVINSLPDANNSAYDAGYNACRIELAPLIDQAACTELIAIDNSNGSYASNYAYPTSIYGVYGHMFRDLIEIELSNVSSNPLTVTVNNYSDCYAYLYMRVTDTPNDESFRSEIIIPPQESNSVDFTSHVSNGERCAWTYELNGVRFAKYEL